MVTKKTKNRNKKQSRSSSSYLNSKANAGPTIKVTGGKFDKADIFVAFGGLLVLIMVVVLGGSQKSNGSTTDSVVNLSSNTTKQSDTISNTTTSSAKQTEEVVSTTSTNASSNAQTDKPDASIEASLQAGNDQSGSPTEETNLKEIDGQQFKLGESMRGNTTTKKEKSTTWGWLPGIFGSNTNSGSRGGGGGTSGAGIERSTASQLGKEKDLVRKELGKKEQMVADKLQDELKFAKQTVKKESNVADKLVDEAKKIKNTTTNKKENYSIVPGVFDDGSKPQIPNVGGAPSNDPFNVFSGPLAQKETQPNIDYSGYGHTIYTGGNSKQHPFKLYPRSGEVFVYEQRPLKRGWADKRYSDNQIDDRSASYAKVVAQNELIQKQRNKLGFASTSFRPIDMKRKFPGDQQHPNFFSSEYMRAEREIGNELGNTGHSWTDSNPKSGIGNMQPGKMGTTNDSALDPGALEKREGDMMKIKTKVKGSVNRIIGLFDRLFYEEIFPDAVVDVQDDGTIYVRDGKEGKCILLARYYEYVQATIKATLGLGRTGPLTWAKSIDLNFEAIEKNKLPLRDALTQTCSPKLGYMLSNEMEVKTIDGQSIEVNIPWPQDQTTLVSHAMKLSAV